jgi:hypothetical protein
VQAPPLVRRAIELAERLGFDRSCSAETGALNVLAAAVERRRLGEIGTGVAVAQPGSSPCSTRASGS